MTPPLRAVIVDVDGTLADTERDGHRPSGAYWVETNADVALPTERGLVPGNGSMVAALRAATDRDTVVAGKPQPAILEDVLARGVFRAPLLIGDRLDTDIACANPAGVPSVLVCTGRSSPVTTAHGGRCTRPV